jgi:hypothetical protein
VEPHLRPGHGRSARGEPHRARAVRAGARAFWVARAGRRRRAAAQLRAPAWSRGFEAARLTPLPCGVLCAQPPSRARRADACTGVRLQGGCHRGWRRKRRSAGAPQHHQTPQPCPAPPRRAAPRPAPPGVRLKKGGHRGGRPERRPLGAAVGPPRVLKDQGEAGRGAQVHDVGWAHEGVGWGAEGVGRGGDSRSLGRRAQAHAIGRARVESGSEWATSRPAPRWSAHRRLPSPPRPPQAPPPSARKS